MRREGKLELAHQQLLIRVEFGVAGEYQGTPVGGWEVNVTLCFMLAIVDLAKIQHIALYHFAPGTPLALDDIPITMLFAVLEPSVASQIHAD